MCLWGDAIARAVVAFLDAVLVGCFLSCLRPRRGPGRSRLRFHPTRSARAQGSAGDVLADDEQGFGGRRGSYEDLPNGGLRREANYLKLCGTISETPAELRNASYQINSQNTNKCDNMPTNALETDGTSVFEAIHLKVSNVRRIIL